MRLGLRVAIGLAAAAVLAVVAAEIALTRVLESDALRVQVSEAMRLSLGRELQYRRLSHSWLPLALAMEGPSIAGEAPDEAPLVTMERLALHPRLLPLLRGQVVIHEATLDTPTVRLVITPDGVRLPAPPGAEAGSDVPEDDGGLALVLERLRVRDGVLVIEDRTRTPSVTWELRELAADAHATSIEDPVRFEVEAKLAGGGDLAGRGTASLAGDVDAAIELDGLDLSGLAPYVGATWAATSRAGGTLALRGDAGAPLAADLDLALAGGELGLEGRSVRGPVSVKGRWVLGDGPPRGDLELDATRAALDWGDVFAKPAGETAAVSARVTLGDEPAVSIDDLRVRIRNAEARGRVAIDDRTRIELRVPSFDVSGWAASLRELAGYRLGGTLAADLGVLTDPLDIRGEVQIGALRIAIPQAGELQLDGKIVGEGPALHTQGLGLVVGGQRIPTDVRFANLSGAPTYRWRFAAQGIDANRWVSTFTSARDVLYGALSIEGDLHGTVDPATPPLDGVRGGVRVDVADGHLVGVSLLKATFDRLGALGTGATRALDLRQLFTGQYVEKQYSEEFESIGGTLDFGNGKVTTRDLRLVYRNFKASLAGEMGLNDLTLDMTGSLTLSEQIDRALGERLRLGTFLLGSNHTIPLAAVRGTLLEPRVEVPDAWAAGLVTSLARLPVDRAADLLRGGARLPSIEIPRPGRRTPGEVPAQGEAAPPAPDEGTAPAPQGAVAPAPDEAAAPPAGNAPAADGAAPPPPDAAPEP